MRCAAEDPESLPMSDEEEEEEEEAGLTREPAVLLSFVVITCCRRLSYDFGRICCGQIYQCPTSQTKPMSKCCLCHDVMAAIMISTC